MGERCHREMVMAATQADLDAIRTQRLRGVRSIQNSDRSITYSPDAELRQVEQDIKRELAAVSPTRRAKRVYGVASSGF